MDEFEIEFLTLRSDKPLVWLRYIGDVLFIWTHEEKQLHKFMEDLSNHQPIIKFTYTSVEIVSFCSIWTSTYQGGELSPNLYIKSADRRQYLYFTSSNHNHTKCFIVYIRALRVTRICSRECELRKHISEMKTWFLRRRYPKNQNESEIKKSSSHIYLTKTLKKGH